MDNQDIYVTIICDVYNHEHYLEKTLDSFLSQQTKYKFEILIHDDKSSDRSREIILSYKKKYPDIINVIFEEENIYNSLIDLKYDIEFPRAKGKYLAFCEGDDYWVDNNKIELCTNFLENHLDYDAVFHSTKVFDVTKNSYIEKYSAGNKECEYTLSHSLNNICHFSSFFIRKSFFAHNKRPNYYSVLKHVRDWPIQVFLTDKSKVWYLPNCMSVYRYKSGPLSYTCTEKVTQYTYYLNAIKFLKMVKKDVNKYNKKIVSSHITNYYLRLYDHTNSLLSYRSLGYFLTIIRFRLLVKR